MRSLLFLFICALSLSTLSCDKITSPGDNFDFSNNLPPYVTLSSTAAKTVRQGNSTTFTFVMRSGLQQTVTVYYDITGAVNQANQTVVFNREALSAMATVTIPAGTIVAPATTATATLTLVKAVAADGTLLTIGQKNNPSSQKVTINITL